MVASAKYRVLVGINYPPDRRAEPGDIVTDIPGKSIKWLVDEGVIERADGKTDAPDPEAVEADLADAPEEA